jgi:cytoskeletal protein CcmA (bactofilin family)
MFSRKPASALTYLSATSEFQGDLKIEGNLRIDGIVHGTVEVQGDVEISQTGLVEGEALQARDIIVHGVIKAHVIAEGRLTLSRTARLEGDVTANSIDIEAGAHFTGHIATIQDTKVLSTSPGRHLELLNSPEPDDRFLNPQSGSTELAPQPELK